MDYINKTLNIIDALAAQAHYRRIGAKAANVQGPQKETYKCTNICTKSLS